MTAARALTDAERRIAAYVIDELERRRRERRRKPEPDVVVSEVEMAMARKIAREMGLHVVEPKGKR